MEVKTFEVRDSATMIPAMAIRMRPDSEQDRYLFARAGFGAMPEQQEQYVILVRLNHVEATYDPIDWVGKSGGTRTMCEAHKIILERWKEFESGAVIDVQYELGETTEKKQSEHTAPLPWETASDFYPREPGT